jgi:hypothetical protein
MTPPAVAAHHGVIGQPAARNASAIHVLHVFSKL